jgi:hypothetical protein
MYTLHCDMDGTLWLRRDGRSLPVFEAYLWELCSQKGMRPEPGEERPVAIDFVTDAVEEALARVSHEIETAVATKRHLLAIFLAAKEAA